MKIHRFIDNFDLSGKELEITGEIAKQMAIVLKLKIGEEIELCDGKGISAIAEIIEINKKRVLVLLRSASFADQNSTKQVNLFCAVLKKENFELIVQKATECGAVKIIPIITTRTIKTGLNLKRLEKIAKEASEQSGRNTIPEISEPIKFEESFKMLEKDDLNILFDKKGKLLFEKSNSKFTNDDKLKTNNLFIGPEGGWTPEEISKAEENNFQIASLGPLTLRGETAAIIATYLISNLK